MACAQLNQNAKDWQEDLLFLQKTVHKDYDFLFKKVEAAQFDAEIDKFYQAIPKLEEHEIIVGFTRIVSLFEYGHTAIGLSGWYDRKPIDFDQMPFNLYHFNDGIYVQGVHKNYQNALGAKVLKVEGVPVEQALKAIRPVVPVENDQYFKAYGLTYLGTPQVLHAQRVTKELKSTVTLTLERDGNLFDVTFDPFGATKFPGQYSLIKEEGDWLDARDNSEDPLYLKNLDRIYFYEHLPESKSLYVRHSQIQDDPEESIPEFYQRVFEFIENNEVERLVLDVRLNGGGNNYKNKPIVTGIIQSEKINQVGKLFVIIGRRTFSACQNLVNELDNYTEAIFVGEPTSENINFFGDNRRIELPNSKVPVRLSFAWWQDKPQWENADWLAPHLAVDMSFEEYRTNQDPVLETVLNFSDDNFIIDPIQHLTELFEAGKFQVLEAEANQMVNDPAYRFIDFNSQFNRAGYSLLGGGKVQEAIYVFELNTKLFPDSANAWDSLAEGFWKADQTEKAIQYYNKAIEMDPEGPTGDNARNMLKEIARGH
ncbi:MAG: hypothetical protein ACR2MX_09915 [Cyclobacteriaceae bacterium]